LPSFRNDPVFKPPHIDWTYGQASYDMQHDENFRFHSRAL
jgi:hypothetical protein